MSAAAVLEADATTTREARREREVELEGVNETRDPTTDCDLVVVALVVCTSVRDEVEGRADADDLLNVVGRARLLMDTAARIML